jgi:ATP-dependent Clp protease ATP-binding subunit ClpA
LFSHFNSASWRVVRVAEQESRNHNDYFIGADHLLAALVEERDPAVLAALRSEGIDLHELHAEVRRCLGSGGERLWEGILVTPRVRTIVTLAEETAGGREVTPLDLYRALRAEGASSAAQLLRRLAARNPAPAAE